MNFSIKLHWITLLIVLLLILTACGQTEDTNPTETPTPTGEIASGSETQVSAIDEPMENAEPADTEAADTDETAVPNEIPDETTPTPEGEYDSCLIGTWGIDKEAFANYLYQTMNQTEGVEFTFSELEGDFEMIIEESVLSYTSTEPLTIKLSLAAGGITLTTLDMIVIGQGSANWTTYENYFVVYGQDYNFHGNGLADTINSDLIGQTEVTVELDPSRFASMARVQNIEIPMVDERGLGTDNYAAATYTCEGDTFTYYFNEYASIWHRK